MSKKITIDPITRLEGHGKIEIFLDDSGNVDRAYLQIPETRGFEKFLEGMPIEEVPRIVTHLCGVCPAAHHLAAAKAVDAVYRVKIPTASKKLRELFYAAHYIHSHTAHFYALAAPDFVLGPGADPKHRNVIGMIQKVGVETGKEVLKQRRLAQDLQTAIAGRATHPVWCIPGGITKGLEKDKRDEFEPICRGFVDFAKLSLKLFNDLVLSNRAYVDLIFSDRLKLDVYSMGTVDENNKVNFYDGKIRVVDQDCKEVYRYDAKDYLHYVSERVEEWSMLKFPYLKKIGWQGFVEGKSSGVYHATPLSRLNAASGMATTEAENEYKKMYETLGKKPFNGVLAMHWARLVELLYAAELSYQLIMDPEIMDPQIRIVPTATPNEGIGSVEAPRGTLTHHYKTDKNGIVTRANLIVGTTNNNAAMNMAVNNAAKAFIDGGNITNEFLNMVEMAFRAFDPCFSCATHNNLGGFVTSIKLYSSDGDTVDSLQL